MANWVPYTRGCIFRISVLCSRVFELYTWQMFFFLFSTLIVCFLLLPLTLSTPDALTTVQCYMTRSEQMKIHFWGISLINVLLFADPLSIDHALMHSPTTRPPLRKILRLANHAVTRSSRIRVDTHMTREFMLI